MKRILLISIVSVFLISCNPAEKKISSKIPDIPKTIDILEPDLDTLPNGKRLLNNTDSSFSMYYKEVVGSDTLKGGYITCYGIDDSTKYFYLRHGSILHLLNQTPIYTSAWSLGIVEKDFDDFFITTIDNGNGVPQTYQVFDKRTAKNLLGDKVEAWAFEYLGDTLFFLYHNHIDEYTHHSLSRGEADSIFLYNVQSDKRQGFKLPEKNSEDIIYYDIKKLTNQSLTISRIKQFTDEKKSIKYRR
jgi:hypothetical protein